MTLSVPATSARPEEAAAQGEGSLDHADGIDPMTAAALSALLEPHGFRVGQYKPAMVQQRVLRRMAILGVTSLPEYLALLKRSAEETLRLSRDLLIHVTEFFRDPGVFEKLQTQFFPRMLLQQRRAKGPFRVWVSGCASGEEAYSLVMTLMECAPNLPVQVFATDLDEHALSVGRTGVYPAAIARQVSAERLSRFFRRHEAGYKVCRQVREAVVFARHDVTCDAPYAGLDFVSCRNLLIYLRPEAQQRVLGNFHYGLRPHGMLLLGPAESAEEAHGLYRSEDARARLYGKQDTGLGVLIRSHEPRRTQRASSAAARVSPCARSDESEQSHARARRTDLTHARAGHAAQTRRLREELQVAQYELTCARSEAEALTQALRASSTRLHHAEHSLSALLGVMQAALVVVDAQLQVVACSTRARERFGFDPNDASLKALAHRLCLSGLVDIVGDVLADGRTRRARGATPEGALEVVVSRAEEARGEPRICIEIVPQATAEHSQPATGPKT